MQRRVNLIVRSYRKPSAVVFARVFYFVYNNCMEKNKFCIIANSWGFGGIGAIAGVVITNVLYSLEKGYIPIVDMKYHQNQYYKDGREFKDNAWEYFFEQPFGYTLDDIDDNSEVIFCPQKMKAAKKYWLPQAALPENTVISLSESTNILRENSKKYIKFNQKTLDYMQEQYSKIVGENQNVLGVLARGTDYSVIKTKGEQIQPSVKDIISKIKEYLKKYPEITKIYLATEDDFIFKSIKSQFGDMIIDNNQYRYVYDSKAKQYLCDIDVERENHCYNLALEYLASLYILSKCKYFIGGRTSGTKMLWIMQDSWQDLYIWSLGRYGANNFIKKIFSVSNDLTIGYKVLIILGFKIKISKLKSSM